MNKTTSEKIRLGIFVLLGTVLLLFGAYQIGNQENLFGDTFGINAVFKNVGGLQKGNNVRYSGINIGTVKGIEMENDTAIRVFMQIQQNMMTHIKKNAIAAIGSDGLVGSMVINIVPGNGDAPLVAENDEIPSLSKIATADMLNTLSVTNENAALLTEDLLKVTASINRGRGTLGRLLNDTLMGNDLKQTLANLKFMGREANITISELNKIVQQFDTEESVAGVLLADSISGEKMRNVISYLETSSLEIEKMAKDLNVVVGSIKDGKGAVNYLTTDTLLVNQLQHTMKNVDQGVARFNENMEAPKHNFLTRGYFRKLEKQEEKEARKRQLD
jgi:phospholipid/cholesterol/gamma-HCH transport system substrate-binding protein